MTRLLRTGEKIRAAVADPPPLHHHHIDFIDGPTTSVRDSVWRRLDVPAEAGR